MVTDMWALIGLLITGFFLLILCWAISVFHYDGISRKEACQNLYGRPITGSAGDYSVCINQKSEAVPITYVCTSNWLQFTEKCVAYPIKNIGVITNNDNND
jgi:hypothetical protein